MAVAAAARPVIAAAALVAISACAPGWIGNVLTCSSLGALQPQLAGRVGLLRFDGFSVDMSGLSMESDWCEGVDVGFRGFLTSDRLNEQVTAANRGEAWNIISLTVGKLHVMPDDAALLEVATPEQLAERWVAAAARHTPVDERIRSIDVPLDARLPPTTKWAFILRLNPKYRAVEGYVRRQGETVPGCLEYGTSYVDWREAVIYRANGFLCPLRNQDGAYAAISVIGEDVMPLHSRGYDRDLRLQEIRRDYLVPLALTFRDET